MYSITWLQTECEVCKKTNWLRLGNMDDQTTADDTHWKCWSCEKLTALGEDFDMDEGSVYICDGKASPT